MKKWLSALIYFPIYFLCWSCESKQEVVSIVLPASVTNIEKLSAKELKEKLQAIYPSQAFTIGNKAEGYWNIYLGKAAQMSCLERILWMKKIDF